MVGDFFDELKEFILLSVECDRLALEMKTAFLFFFYKCSLDLGSRLITLQELQIRDLLIFSLQFDWPWLRVCRAGRGWENG